MTTATPFLMFQNGNAKAALELYTSTFPDSQVIQAEYYAEGEHGQAGTIKVATFTLCGRAFMCSDSPISHDFDFTPSSSVFVEFDSVPELESAYQNLSEGGQVLMPMGDYGFSRMFGWVNDTFGVSWQLNVPS